MKRKPSHYRTGYQDNTFCSTFIFLQLRHMFTNKFVHMNTTQTSQQDKNNMKVSEWMFKITYIRREGEWMNDQNNLYTTWRWVTLHDRNNLYTTWRWVILHDRNNLYTTQRWVILHDRNKLYTTRRWVILHDRNNLYTTSRWVILRDRIYKCMTRRWELLKGRINEYSAWRWVILRDRINQYMTWRWVILRDRITTYNFAIILNERTLNSSHVISICHHNHFMLNKYHLGFIFKKYQ